MAKIKGIWRFNDEINLANIGTVTVNFSVGTSPYYANQTSIVVDNLADNTNYQRIMIVPSYTNIFYADRGWQSNDYKIIDFGQTEQEVSDEFATWLYENAKDGKITFPSADSNIKVLIRYNGTQTLATAGTYCESDIDLDVDVLDSHPVLQEKAVTENGEVIADDGYDGLAKVVVNVPTFITVATEEEANDTDALPIVEGQIIVVTGA